MTVSKFSRVRLKGFRRLKDVDVPLGSLNVLVGPNGAGKSTFLDSIKLLAASANGELSQYLSARRGINEQITSNADVREISFELNLDRENNPVPMYYSLGLEASGIGYRVSDERLAEVRTPGSPPFLHITSQSGHIRYFNPEAKHLVPPSWEHNHSETSLHQVLKTFPDAESFKKQLASVELFHHLDTGPQAPVRLPQAMQPAPLPGTNGEYLLSFLYALREQQPDRFETFEDTLKTGFPGFQRLGFPPVAAGTIAMTWHEQHMRDPIYTHQLSEGTLRFIWLAAILQSRQLPAITLIDEPEISLHPQLLGLLVDLMRDAASRTQLIVATHSERLIRYLAPSEVIVCGIGIDGFAKLRSAVSLDLEGWMQDFSLDELWRMGKFEDQE